MFPVQVLTVDLSEAEERLQRQLRSLGVWVEGLSLVPLGGDVILLRFRRGRERYRILLAGGMVLSRNPDDSTSRIAAGLLRAMIRRLAGAGDG